MTRNCPVCQLFIQINTFYCVRFNPLLNELNSVSLSDKTDKTKFYRWSGADIFINGGHFVHVTNSNFVEALIGRNFMHSFKVKLGAVAKMQLSAPWQDLSLRPRDSGTAL